MKYILVVALLLSTAMAWWDRGHLLTARIAQAILEKEDPDTFTQVNNILSTLKSTDPVWTKNEQDHPFTECATFADFIKAKGGGYQKSWHFVDQPMVDDGDDIKNYPGFVWDTHNCTEVIAALSDWFNNTPGYNKSYEYQQIMNHTYKDHSEKNGMSTAMRFLIHYTGDVHQPLHATARVNKDYPKGDFGGNAVPLPPQEGAENLHAVWDSVIYEYTGYSKLPFTASMWKEISDTATGLMSKYDISKEEASILDPMVWAHESFVISQNTVYPSVSENDDLSPSYIANAKKVAERQVVLGGHRLANVLMSFHLKGHEQAKPKTLYARALEAMHLTQTGIKGKILRMIDSFCSNCGYF